MPRYAGLFWGLFAWALFHWTLLREWLREWHRREWGDNGYRRFRFRRGRLCLEAFEERCVPAADVVWIGDVSSDWNNAANWSPNTEVPGNDDVVWFEGTRSNRNCTANIRPSVHGLKFAEGYTATLTLNNGIDVWSGGMSLATAGSISQPNGSQSSIALYGNSSWTRGTINSSSSLSEITVADTVSFTVDDVPGNIGSKIVNDGILRFGPNITTTPTFTNNAGIDNFASMFIEQSGSFYRAAGGTGILRNYGTLTKSGSTATESQLPIHNTGQLLVEEGTLHVSQQYTVYGVSVYQNGGLTRIAAGATLKVTYGYRQDSGGLVTTGEGESKIAIGNVTINDGYVKIGDNPNDNNTLRVDGAFVMLSGTFEITIRGGFTPSADQLSVGGNIQLGDGLGTEPYIAVEHSGGPPANGVTVPIIMTDMGSEISGQFAGDLVFPQGWYEQIVSADGRTLSLRWWEW